MKPLGRDEYQKVQYRARSIISKIDYYLSKYMYEEIFTLLSDSLTIELSGKNEILYILEIMGRIQQIEQGDGKQGVFFNRNIEEICNIYNELTILLIRIEFSLPKIYQDDLSLYVQKKKLSWLCVIGVAQASPYILDKEGIVDKIGQLIDDEKRVQDE